MKGVCKKTSKKRTTRYIFEGVRSIERITNCMVIAGNPIQKKNKCNCFIFLCWKIVIGFATRELFFMEETSSYGINENP